jgi:hypothetical protein
MIKIEAKPLVNNKNSVPPKVTDTFSLMQTLEQTVKKQEPNFAKQNGK